MAALFASEWNQERKGEEIINMDTMFTINGKEYKAQEFDVNTICDLEEMGTSIENMASKPFSMIRGYFSLCAKKSVEYAGKELQAHIVKGGKMEDISEPMSKMMKNSDFFRALKEIAEEEDSEEEDSEDENKAKKESK